MGNLAQPRLGRERAGATTPLAELSPHSDEEAALISRAPRPIRQGAAFDEYADVFQQCRWARVSSCGSAWDRGGERLIFRRGQGHGWASGRSVKLFNWR